jgi:MSHA biogenesis protein MshQ
VAGASEPANYTWTMSTSGFGGAVGGIASFSGVDTATPYDDEAGNATPSSANHTAPSVTTTLDDGMLVTIHEFASSKAWTPPTGMTEMVDVASLPPNDTDGISMEMNYEVRPAAGATGTRTASPGGPPDSGAVQSISLKPAPLVCYTDDFNRADGSPGSDWVVSNSSGSFGDPVIVNNRLRLTDASGNVATMATLQRLFPGSGNRIEVEFEHYADGGSGADGIAIALSDSAVTPAPGGYGGSLGYAQRTGINGFAGGWLGVGIDEYGNFSNPTEGRVGGPGLIIDSISIRGSGSGTSGYAYHAGTATLTPQVDNNGAASPPHKYRIIVDHSNGANALVSVERDTGSGYVTLVSPYDAKAQAGQAAVPTSWMLSYTGSTGGATNIHEIDGLRICATSQTPISAIDHFEITVAASASTCAPHTVTIVAKDATNTTLTDYTGAVTLSTSTGHGTWAKSTSAPIPGGTLTPGADNGTAAYTFVVGDNGSIVLTLDNQRAEDLTMTVVDASVPATATTSGTVSYLDNAFLISPTDALGTTVVAGRDHAMKAELWRCERVNPTTCNTCSIAAGYGGAKNLDAWYTADPDHPAGASAPAIGALTLPNAAPAVNPASNNLTTLSFTNGVANFNLTTSDVGKYTLNLRDDTGGFASAVNIGGTSAILTVRPFALHVDVSGNPGASAAGGSIFTSAGTDFTATVRGVLWEAGDDADDNGAPDSGAVLSNNGVTQRYAWDTTLSAAAPYTPAAGVLGSTSNGTVLQADFSGGSATVNDLRYSEVGSFTIRGAASNYLNSGINFQADDGVVGRFTPAYFDVAVTAACGPVGTKFTYSGQPLSMVTVTAKAANLGTTTQNYDGTLGFDKDVTVSNAGDASNFTNNVITAGGFASGIRNQTGVTYTFPAKETVPVTLALRAVDSDSISSAGHTEETAEIRSGRVHLVNAYGSELGSLSVPMRVEYFSVDGWVKSTADTCTALDDTLLDLQNAIDNPPQGTNSIDIKAGNSSTVTVVSPSAGVGELTFSKPDVDGYADASMNLSTRAWLRYDWDDNGAEEDPTGRATFGLYRGSPKHIYQRQRY